VKPRNFEKLRSGMDYMTEAIHQIQSAARKTAKTGGTRIIRN
jgi:hypothetical protein